MSTRNRFSPLAPDELFPPHRPSAEGHRVIEFEDRPLTPVEGRTPLPVDATILSSAQDQEQGSIHEVCTILSIFERDIEYGTTLAGRSRCVHP